MEPEDIPLGVYTHINFAFALVHPKTFRIEAMDAETLKLYQRVTKLKEGQPGLQVWTGQSHSEIYLDLHLTKPSVAIGGWAMNDPSPYRTTFSDLAKFISAQDAFSETLVSFMRTNNFDGTDIAYMRKIYYNRCARCTAFCQNLDTSSS
jgi:chitinase